MTPPHRLLLAPVVATACVTTPAGQAPTPLVSADEPTCPPSTLPFGGECVDTTPFAIAGDEGAVAWFAPRQVDGRTWWFTPGPIDQATGAAMCRALNARLFTPRTARDVGVGRHFASLGARSASGEAVVWTGWRVDLQTGDLVDEDGQALMRWLPSRPPTRGFPADDLDGELQRDLDRVAQGLAPEQPNWCFPLMADGSLEVRGCSVNCCPVVCEAF